jgi:hypothetical protein
VVGGFFLLTALLGALWALATPIWGVPDEPAHVVRAASVVRGEIVGSPEVEWQDKRVDVARVPEPLARVDPPCFAFTSSPSCDRGPYGRGDVLKAVENPFATYNPVYYALVGIPTVIDPHRNTVYAMRMLTAAMVAALLTLAFVAVLDLGAPGWALVGLGVATTPMTLFLAGSVNPSAIEVSSGLALWATLLVWFASPDARRERRRAMSAVVAGIVLVSTRALAPFFLLLIVPGALLASGRRLREIAGRPAAAAAAAVAVATVAALGWTAAAGTLSTTGVHAPQYENVRRFGYDVALSLDDYERQMIGVFGWLDTPAQAHVYVVWFMLLGLLVLAGMAIGSTRQRATVLLLVSASAIVPFVVQWPVAPELGLIWQGRYLLPLMVGLPLVAGVALALHGGWNDVMGGRWALWTPLTVIGVLQAASFWWALHRNVIGLSKPWIGFTPTWQPPLGWIPLTLAYAVAVTAWVAVLGRAARPEGSVGAAAQQRAQHA